MAALSRVTGLASFLRPGLGQLWPRGHHTMLGDRMGLRKAQPVRAHSQHRRGRGQSRGPRCPALTGWSRVPTSTHILWTLPVPSKLLGWHFARRRVQAGRVPGSTGLSLHSEVSPSRPAVPRRQHIHPADSCRAFTFSGTLSRGPAGGHHCLRGSLCPSPQQAPGQSDQGHQPSGSCPAAQRCVPGPGPQGRVSSATPARQGLAPPGPPLCQPRACPTLPGSPPTRQARRVELTRGHSDAGEDTAGHHLVEVPGAVGSSALAWTPTPPQPHPSLNLWWPGVSHHPPGEAPGLPAPWLPSPPWGRLPAHLPTTLRV